MTNVELRSIITEAVREAMIAHKEVLTLEEAAQFLGLKKSALYKLTHTRLIPFSKPNGKMCFFSRAALENWMLSNPVATQAEINAKVLGYCMEHPLPHSFQRKRP